MKELLSGKIRFEQVRGVGTMELDFLPEQRVYTLIGENGVGKTKFLESWFSVLLLSSNSIIRQQHSYIQTKYVPFKKFNKNDFSLDINKYGEGYSPANNNHNITLLMHNFPVVYLSAQHRGELQSKPIYERNRISELGNKSDRKDKYIQYLLECFNGNPERIRNLNMDVDIEEWIVQRAQSANPYQAEEDNREIELKTLLDLLNKIDERIDPLYLKTSGSNEVFIRIENQKRELSELSSGFSSILKILQSIIAGYSYFTNETQIANVRGVVLIDEIESHLHNQWQVKIIPLLKKLFPNTTFFITTHSSLVISQLEHGEAYRLERDKSDGVVYGKLIDYPSNVSFIDLLHDAFDVNLNELKRLRLNEDKQQEAKKALLQLVQQELANMENK
ncbi:AAA family ATPase [Rodentibacter sp. Ppn85]|uniref:AAA family ATPase n=1 Tax=Rodentibacter sp. Ppn85 TaxID=1908525 RepID=UPI000986B0BF|nr:AAA family ATPase [Rodentibacter sp. Ppn85]OOF61557.1 cytochrome C nitrite reductase [Rodentibacter sp. Ppn85]